jgi:hypothetical protein
VDAAGVKQTHRGLESSPGTAMTATLPQMKKEMFVTWLLPDSSLGGILTSGNTRNHKPGTE